jgi:hypothetical protein
LKRDPRKVIPQKSITFNFHMRCAIACTCANAYRKNPQRMPMQLAKFKQQNCVGQYSHFFTSLSSNNIDTEGILLFFKRKSFRIICLSGKKASVMQNGNLSQNAVNVIASSGSQSQYCSIAGFSTFLCQIGKQVDHSLHTKLQKCKRIRWGQHLWSWLLPSNEEANLKGWRYAYGVPEATHKRFLVIFNSYDFLTHVAHFSGS